MCPNIKLYQFELFLFCLNGFFFRLASPSCLEWEAVGITHVGILYFIFDIQNFFVIKLHFWTLIEFFKNIIKVTMIIRQKLAQY